MLGLLLAAGCVGCAPRVSSFQARNPVVCALESGRVTCETIDRENDYSTEVSMEGVASMSMGGYAVCALSEGGEVRCEGFSIADLLTPPPGPWSAVDVGNSHACAVDADGAPTCWGADYDNALVVPSGTRLSNIVAGGNRTCGTRVEDDTWLCWGTDTSYLEQTGTALGVPEPGTVLTQFDMAGVSLIGVRSDGTVGYWGVPGDIFGLEAVPSGSGWVKVHAGNRFACALQASGHIACWGDMTSGQDQIPEGTYKDVAAGEKMVCAIDEDDVVTCWGCGGECVVPQPELW